MTKKENIDWLFLNGNTIIKYLLATSYRKFAHERDELFQHMYEHEVVRYWLHCFRQVQSKMRIHDSFDYCFENAMGKILLFKIRNETIKETEQVLLKLVERSIIYGERIFKHHVFDVEIIISYLLRAGLAQNPLVRDFTLHRLEEVYACIQKYGYDIYVDKNDFKGIPKAFHDKPLVNPKIVNEHINSLPTIWDITLFQSVFINDTGYNTQEYQTKVTHILNYIMNEDYQKLPFGYGIQCSNRKTYHAIGWSVHLPGYKNRERFQASALLYYADLLSQYPPVIHSDWFGHVLSILEQYKVGSGRYIFPKEFIPEKKHSYFVGGGHMGLGENRRKKKSYEIESTYWMLKIGQNIQDVA